MSRFLSLVLVVLGCLGGERRGRKERKGLFRVWLADCEFIARHELRMSVKRLYAAVNLQRG